MENIDIFDRYIKDEMTEIEVSGFELRLKSDPEFAKEFYLYLYTLRGILKEEQQNNLEFYHAMRNISPEGLRRAIGEKDHKRAPEKDEPVFAAESECPQFDMSIPMEAEFANECFDAFDSPSRSEASAPYIKGQISKPQMENVSLKKKNPFRKERMIWIGSIAAMLLICITIGLGYQRSVSGDLENVNAELIAANNRIDNLVAADYYLPATVSRGGEGLETSGLTFPESLDGMSQPQLIELAKKIESTYPIIEDSQDRLTLGINLAMIQLRLHDREAARTTLTRLATEFKDTEPDYAATANEILTAIGK